MHTHLLYTSRQGEAQDNRQAKSTARMPVPQIFVEGVSMDVEEAKDDEKARIVYIIIIIIY